MLGKALGARRKDVALVTKCGLGWQGSELDRPRPGRDSRRDYIVPLVEQSLERMQTDYIDVLLVHYPDPTRLSRRPWRRWTAWCSRGRRGTWASRITA